VNPVTGSGCTSIDIGGNANLKLMDTFLLFMWYVECGWRCWCNCGDQNSNKDISLKVRGRLYSSSVWSSMLHGSETWPVTKENEVALQWAEMRMVKVDVWR